MEENKVRKVIIMSLTGLLIGSLLYIFGLSVRNSIWPLIANYIMAMLLFLSSFLAVYNNNKIDNQPLYKYIMVLALVLIVLITYSTISTLV